MARIRTVKPEVFKHETLFDLEKETGLPIRFAWIGLFTVCDRDGRFKWMPRRLGAEILPYDGVDFSRVLHAWRTRGLVVMYRVKNGDPSDLYGYIPTFSKHQFINNKELPSSLPDPKSEDCLELFDFEQLPALTDTHRTGDLRVPHACLTEFRHGKGEGKGREGKGKERNSIVGNEKLPALRSNGAVGIRTEYPGEFEELWNSYGRRGDKKAAFQEYKKLSLQEGDLQVLSSAVKNYIASNPDPKYRKHLCRFLLTDWRDTAKAPAGNGLHPKTQERLNVYERWKANKTQASEEGGEHGPKS